MAHEHEHHHSQDAEGEHAAHQHHHAAHGHAAHEHHHAAHPPGCPHAGHGGHAGHHEMMAGDFRRRFWVSLALTVPVLLLSPMIRQFLRLGWLTFPGDLYVLAALASAVYVYGGRPFLVGLVEEVGQRQPGMMTLVGVAITAAYAYSTAVVLGVEGELFYWELATLIDIMLLGHWLEMRSVLGASRALEELGRLLPEEAHRLREDGSVEEVPVSALRVGDRILVKPGERIPADGRVVAGRSSVNEALLTGESAPVERGEGEEVIGGAINGEGSLTLEIEKTGEQTYLSQVVRMVREAQQSRSRSQDLADRAAFWLTVIALSVGAATLAAWLLAGQVFAFALERAITVMVITCPHALGLAIPLVVAVSTALGAGRGLLVRNRAAFEQARRVQAVIFDKTGTLTEGRFGVQAVAALDGEAEEEVLRLAAGVESHSEHPIAQGVVRGARQRHLTPARVTEFQTLPGKGARAMVDGRRIGVVSPGYLREQGIEVDRERVRGIEGEGRTIVYVLEGDRPIGAVALADAIREQSREAIARLRARGVRVMMLTGDNERVARWVAGELGLDEYFAEVLPEEKARKVEGIRGRGLLVAMVGDGVNDAPALAQADIGVAIGAGTDVAIETADVVLVKNDARNVVDMLELSRATYRKMVENLAWATGYNVIAIPLAAGVLAGAGVVLSPAVGAVLMSASTVIVAINARLLRLPRPEPVRG